MARPERNDPGFNQQHRQHLAQVFRFIMSVDPHPENDTVLRLIQRALEDAGYFARHPEVDHVQLDSLKIADRTEVGMFVHKTLQSGPDDGQEICEMYPPEGFAKALAAWNPGPLPPLPSHGLDGP